MKYWTFFPLRQEITDQLGDTTNSFLPNLLTDSAFASHYATGGGATLESQYADRSHPFSGTSSTSSSPEATGSRISDFGRLPVWGYGTIVASRSPALGEGTRLYGIWPTSTYLVLEPEQLPLNVVKRSRSSIVVVPEIVPKTPPAEDPDPPSSRSRSPKSKTVNRSARTSNSSFAQVVPAQQTMNSPFSQRSPPNKMISSLSPLPRGNTNMIRDSSAQRGSEMIIDVHPHRREHLPIVYRTYRICDETTWPLLDKCCSTEEDENRLALLHPLFATAFFLEDYLKWHGYFGADSLIVSSASCKTAVCFIKILYESRRRQSLTSKDCP
ncbi:unnamed protein product [Amoebophrya sp. A25]|nr:unnamed protein product [Amoebophrya sp. A25]|eukprot:GSA25T00004555001.1